MATYDNKIAISSYCNDTSKSNDNNGKFSGNDRIENKTPLLTCPNTNETYGGYYKLKIGLLTADEGILGGLIANKMVDSGTLKNYLYQTNTESWSWYLTPTSYYNTGGQQAYVSYQRTAGVVRGRSLPVDGNIYQVINLKSDVKVVSGDGTENNPYIIE